MSVRPRMLAFALLLAATAVQGHPLAPALLDLRESAPGVYDVSWRTSVVSVRGTPVAPQWPPGCAAEVQGVARIDGEDALLHRWRLSCPGGIEGRRLAIDGLAAGGINAILRYESLDGGVAQTLLDAAQPQWTVPAAGAAKPVFVEYLRLGFTHLLAGPDHVLLILGLVALVRRPRALVGTVTAFTLGHSLTLSAAALGLLRLPSALAEVLIAATLVVLALQLLRPGGAGALERRPWWIAAVFGLIHGLGFAGALAEVGLPQREIALALLAFNLGIECGQLLLVLVFLAGIHAARRSVSVPAAAPLHGALAYVIGSLAAYWVIGRAAVLVAGVGTT
ncbi:HupE/UreJ family protein [Fontimonas sp. SYSU GA230001]|uniref:HupE/UreJ family protein n=1 Tax=Fontimonas sp. SYSU GA230001 TaxID=3142450 RepID=UPI0032B40794